MIGVPQVFGTQSTVQSLTIVSFLSLITSNMPARIANKIVRAIRSHTHQGELEYIITKMTPTIKRINAETANIILKIFPTWDPPDNPVIIFAMIENINAINNITHTYQGIEEYLITKNNPIPIRINAII